MINQAEAIKYVEKHIIPKALELRSWCTEEMWRQYIPFQQSSIEYGFLLDEIKINLEGSQIN